MWFDEVVLWGGISGDGWYIFLTAYLCVWVMAPPPPWDPVGTGNFWPVLAACPLPQAGLRQQHFRECLSTGGESEKETNSRGPRKLRQPWEWFEKKGVWGSRGFATDLQINFEYWCTTWIRIWEKGVVFFVFLFHWEKLRYSLQHILYNLLMISQKKNIHLCFL